MNMHRIGQHGLSFIVRAPNAAQLLRRASSGVNDYVVMHTLMPLHRLCIRVCAVQTTFLAKMEPRHWMGGTR